MSDSVKPELISPPNTLKTKVGTGGPGAVDLEALERAEQVIAGLTDQYLDWVAEDLVNIQAAFDKLRGDLSASEVTDRIFQIAHDIKGQGGSFGYDLMTILGNSLCRFLEGMDRSAIVDSDLDVIGLHINTMKLVLAKRMKDDGGIEGQKLLKGLELVVQKVAAKK